MKRLRLKTALSNLEKQLKDGVKTVKGTLNEKTPLNQHDINRINKEIVSIKDHISKL
jgi:hypothetical protein